VREILDVSSIPIHIVFGIGLNFVRMKKVLLAEEGVWSMAGHLWLLVCGVPVSANSMDCKIVVFSILHDTQQG
jgi:hypothetical protein